MTSTAPYWKWLPIFCLCLLPLDGQSLWAQARSDTLQLADGTAVRGEITATSPNEIEITTREGTRKVSVGDLRRMLIEDEPSALRSARESIAGGQFEQALQSLERVPQEEQSNPLVSQELEFYRTFARTRLAIQNGEGEAEAAKALVAFVAKNRESIHFYAAAEALGDLARSLGRHDKAAQYYGQLKTAAWPAMKYRGLLLEADSLQLHDPSKASSIVELYDQVIQASEGSNETRRLKELAKVGRAQAQARSGQAAEAVKILNAVIAENDSQDTQLFGRAYLALGNCYLALQQPDDALLALLHVDLLFHDDPENHAQALHHLIALWDQNGNKERAADARNRLHTRYASSAWAKRG